MADKKDTTNKEQLKTVVEAAATGLKEPFQDALGKSSPEVQKAFEKTSGNVQNVISEAKTKELQTNAELAGKATPEIDSTAPTLKGPGKK